MAHGYLGHHRTGLLPPVADKAAGAEAAVAQHHAVGPEVILPRERHNRDSRDQYVGWCTPPRETETRADDSCGTRAYVLLFKVVVIVVVQRLILVFRWRLALQ